MGGPVTKMSLQAQLPGTLPTPREARNSLRMARSAVKEKGNVVDGMEERQAASKEEVEAALEQVEEVENDLLDAAEDSPEYTAADAGHQKAWKRAERAESDLGKVGAVLRLARGELAAAVKQLAAARADIEAIREGRRLRR